MRKIFGALALLTILFNWNPRPAAAQTPVPMRIVLPNEGSTGTGLNNLAKAVGAPSTARYTAPGDTSGALGVVIGGAGTTGSAIIQFEGLVSCQFDAATTAGDYVQISASSTGECTDAGATYPTAGGQVLGRVLSTNGSNGFYTMFLFPPDMEAPVVSGALFAPWSEYTSGGLTNLGTVTGNDNMLLTFLNAAGTGSAFFGTNAGDVIAQVSDITSGWVWQCERSLNVCQIGTGSANTQSFAGYDDVTEIGSPGNPPSGKDRRYFNNSTHKYTCLTSSGGNCFPSGAPRDFGTTWGDSAGGSLSSGSVVYFTVPYACTIQAWNLSVNAGTATVDIWKIASGTAVPTVANTITASALPSIGSGTSVHSTTLTGWTTSVAANDIFGFQLQAVSVAAFVEVDVQCQP